MAKNLGGIDSPANESQGGTNATTFNDARTNMGLNPLLSEKTLTYNVVAADRGLLIHYSGAGGVDLTLTAAATLGDGFNFILRNDAAGNITINPDGGELINGAATLVVEPGQAVNVICTGAAFYTEGQAAQIDGANQALSNLTATAINTSLISDTDVTDDLGSFGVRWNSAYVASFSTGHTAAQTMTFGAWDVDGAILVDFITFTAGNNPTCVFSGDITGVTQAPGTNNTTLATTAYADAIGAASAPIGATYITQTPDGTLTNEQALSLLATGIMKSTTATGVVSIAVAGTDYVDPATTITIAGTANEITSSAGAQDLSTNRTWTLSLPAALTFTGKTITGGAYDGASATNFTFTTGSIGTAVTAVTQAPLDNSTKVATTAYVDNAIAPITVWHEVVGTSDTLAVNDGYVANNAALVTLTLPASATLGDTLEIIGKGAGGWLIAQNANQAIHLGNVVSTTGVGGSIASTDQYDTISLVCITGGASTIWSARSAVGNLTVV